ncbi:MAG: nicotinamide riboside transporter PnuC [Betaproteobacteria bacterium]|nr:nicotinamide riboside transporter PnuC [Betaproteobacteria bacterium]
MTDPVEWAGFVLSLAMVYCNIKEIHWGWPLAILSSILYGTVFWNSQLYGEASLQIMFILTAAWGWQQWLRGTARAPLITDAAENLAPPPPSKLSITTLQPAERRVVFIATLLAWPAFSFFLHRYTDSDVAIWDGLVTALSLLGQYLLGRKKIENWWVWMLVNVLTVGLMVEKSLWLTAVLYGIFAVLSYMGVQAWRRHAH